jgi:hypothetical protein
MLPGIPIIVTSSFSISALFLTDQLLIRLTGNLLPIRLRNQSLCKKRYVLNMNCHVFLPAFVLRGFSNKSRKVEEKGKANRNIKVRTDF